MKKMSTKNWNVKKYFTKITILYFCLVLLWLFLSFLMFCTVAFPQDCTHEYVVYKDVKKFTTIDELKEEAKELGIEYIISDGKIELKNYKMFYFQHDSKGSCEIITKDNTLKAFEVIDSGELDNVKIEGNLNSEGEIEEKISYSPKGVKVTKRGNNYFRYYKRNSFYAVSFLMLAICFVYLLICEIKNIKKNSKLATTNYTSPESTPTSTN